MAPKIKNKVLLTLIGCIWNVLFVPVSAWAQTSPSTLSASELLDIIRQFHPVIKQADIQIKKSLANQINARGQFDPVFTNYVSKKTLDGTEYYTTVSPEINIPTWYGIEVSGGIENISGNRVDNSQTFGKSSYVGVGIPLAKNLLFDKRRAALKSAEVFVTMAYAEQQLWVNNLLMTAMEDYWKWVASYRLYQIMANNVALNQTRLTFIVKSYQNGERAAIDTVEAFAQLQSFQYLLNQYELEFKNAGLDLSAYLWNAEGQPYLLPETIVPNPNWENDNTLSAPPLMELLSEADARHPDIKLYQSKLDLLQIEKRLKFQELLPKIDFKYNLLSKGYNAFNQASSALLFENNYQYGLKMAVPLRFSEGRGQYKLAKLKLQEVNYDLVQKRLAIQLKVKSYFNEYLYLQKQVSLQTNNYNNFKQLVQAEELRLENGESSLFLVNSRENKALEALEKLITLKTKYYKTIFALQWSAGLLK